MSTFENLLLARIANNNDTLTATAWTALMIFLNHVVAMTSKWTCHPVEVTFDACDDCRRHSSPACLHQEKTKNAPPQDRAAVMMITSTPGDHHLPMWFESQPAAIQWSDFLLIHVALIGVPSSSREDVDLTPHHLVRDAFRIGGAFPAWSEQEPYVRSSGDWMEYHASCFQCMLCVVDSNKNEIINVIGVLSSVLLHCRTRQASQT